MMMKMLIKTWGWWKLWKIFSFSLEDGGHEKEVLRREKRYEKGRGRGDVQRHKDWRKGLYTRNLRRKLRERKRGWKNDEVGVRDGLSDAWLHSIRNWHAKWDMWQLDITQLHARVLLVVLQGKKSCLQSTVYSLALVLFLCFSWRWCNSMNCVVYIG